MYDRVLFVERSGRDKLFAMKKAGDIQEYTPAALAVEILEQEGDLCAVLEALAELTQPEERDTTKCPFCGEDVEFEETEYDSEGGYEKWACPSCGHSGNNIMSAPKFVQFDGLWDADGNSVDLD